MKRLLLALLFFAVHASLACSNVAEPSEESEPSSERARDLDDDHGRHAQTLDAGWMEAGARTADARREAGAGATPELDSQRPRRDGSTTDEEAKPSPRNADASLSPASGDGGTMSEPADGSGAAPPCEKGKVKGSEVIFIGESFIAATGAIPRNTTELARRAGSIGATESYRSYAVSGTQLTTGEIPGQYARAVRDGPVKVVLMDGGGNDLLIGGRCETGFDTRCKEIVSAVQAMFAQMETDGVAEVVYFFYPDPMGIGSRIKAGMDILRPEMKRACEGASSVRCVWVDLRESWEGNYARFTSDGIHPSAAGSMASATQIWNAMVENCIAQ